MASHTHRRISWAAIFGGVVLVVVVQLLLSTLGAGIGLGTVNMNAGTTPDAGNLGMGAGIWWVISSCIALFCGGYVAAWLVRFEVRFDGVLHGIIAWGIATLLTIYLLTSAIGGDYRRRVFGAGQCHIRGRKWRRRGSKPTGSGRRGVTGHDPAASPSLSAANQPGSGWRYICPQDAQKDVATKSRYLCSGWHGRSRRRRSGSSA